MSPRQCLRPQGVLTAHTLNDPHEIRSTHIINESILCVDDDAALLKLYESQLTEFDVVVAEGGDKGLAAVKDNGPFAVIVSDLNMPGMNGAVFLARVREDSPNSVRMLMTGVSDLTAALDAINHGNLFRFLRKPCPRESFRQAIRDGIEQHRLITAEKELLEQTLLGSIEVLTEILSLVCPIAFGKASRIRSLVQQLGDALQFPNSWLLEVAAMLSQIGCVTIPDPILSKLYSGTELTKDERRVYATHPKIGRDLVIKIPRLEEVAQIIFHQDCRHDDACAFGVEEKSATSLGAQILKVAIDCDELESTGHSRRAAIKALLDRPGWYAPDVLNALERIHVDETALARDVVLVRHLRTEMILAEDLKNKSGAVLAPKGQRISDTLLSRVLNHVRNGNVCDSVQVLLPRT